MTSRKTYIVTALLIVAAIFVAAFVLTIVPDKPQGNFIDRGNRHEVVESKSYEAKMDTQGEVTGEVKPLDLSPESSVWKFEVTLDTHSVELDDDMATQSVLIGEQGREYPATAWEGDPPGGHHREGILTLNPVIPFPASITLKIKQVGETAERTFVWGMNGQTSSDTLDEKVYIALEGEGTVTVLDPAQKKMITTIDLSGQFEGMTVQYMAHNIQVAPDGKSVWVTANAMTEEAMGEGHGGEETEEGTIDKQDASQEAELFDQVIVIDPQTDLVIERIPIAVDSHLAHVVLSPDSRTAYITLQEKGALYTVNTESFSIKSKIDLGSNAGPHGARVSPDGTRVFIALMGAKGLAVLDTKTNNVQTYSMGSAVVQTAVTPNGRFVLASLYETKQVARLDIATGEMKKIDLPKEAKGPVQLYATPDSRFVYVADQGYYLDQPTSNIVYRIEVAPGIVDQTIPAGTAPHGVVIDAEGKFAYITNLVSDDVSIIDIKANKEVARIPVGDMPNGISMWNRTRGGMP